jgi:hypothetical protein
MAYTVYGFLAGSMADVVHAAEKCNGQKIAARAILMGAGPLAPRGGGMLGEK